jgi:hypothetical protein
VCAAGIRLTQGRSTYLAASHTAPVASEAVALPLAGGSQEHPGALGHDGWPSSCYRLLPPLGRTRGRTVDAASSASYMSARTWQPAELPSPSRASARPDTGKHGRRRLASSASSTSARPWRLAELPPPSPGGAASSATWGCTAGGAQPWWSAELPPSPASARPMSRTRGYFLLVGPSAARPAASSSSTGLDACIHAQSCSMTLSEHRKLEKVRVVHVWPKAMCVHPQRSRLGTSSEHSRQVDEGPRLTKTCSSCLCSCNTSDQFFASLFVLSVSSSIYFPLSWSRLF